MKRFDKVDANKFNKMLQDALNKKDIRCNDCGKLIKFTTEEEFEKENENIPYVFGTTMICNYCEFEDDITQGHIIYKNGHIDNLYDYLVERGLFEDIKSWEEALNILDTIEMELKDRQRVTVKKEGEVSLEEKRAFNLKNMFSVAFPGSVDVEEQEDGIWEVFGGAYLKGKEGNAVGFRASFLPNENRVPIMINVHNIEAFNDASKTINNFENNITKDVDVKELCEKYEVMFGASEDEAEGAIVVQYEFDDYAEKFIVETYFKIVKSTISNIYGFKKDDIDVNTSRINTENYTSIKALTGYLEGYNDCVDDLYLEEYDYEENEDYVKEIEKKKIDLSSTLSLSNDRIEKNAIEVRISDEFYSEDCENIITITSTKNGNKVVFNLELTIEGEYIESYMAKSHYEVLSIILNANANYLANGEVSLKDSNLNATETPEMSYFKSLEEIVYSYNNALINLVTAIELLNKQNNIQLRYTTNEYIEHGYCHSFDIFTENMRVHGQADDRDNNYRINTHSNEWEEDISLKELLETILSKIGIDEKVEECLEQIESNLIVEKKEGNPKTEVTREVVDEAIRVHKAIESIPEFYEEYDMEDIDGYIEDNRIEVSTKGSGEFISVESSFCIEHKDCKFIISIERFTENNNCFAYDLSIINKGKSFKTLKVEGIVNLIALINNIRYYGEKAFEMENCFELNNGLTDSYIKSIYIVPEEDIRLLDLFSEIKRDYPHELSTLTFREDMYDSDHYITISKNSEKYVIYSYDDGSYSVVLNQGYRNGSSVCNSEVKTKREVLNTIFGKIVDGDIRRQKLNEINIMSKIYCERIFSIINSLEYMLNNETDKSTIKENMQDSKMEVNCIYSKMRADIEWLYCVNEYNYQYRVDSELSALENLRKEFKLLKEEKNELLDENSNLKEIKDKDDARAIMSLLTQLCWALWYHRL